ncbi:MAG: class I mannose-6-phosphate isomerase [Anaerolineae bacterium]|nr:class I mannose-6-phosphate isomerase [Anaerolineae bacterium]
MADPRIYPLTFTPVLRDYLWGGRRLATLYGRALPPGAVAESWEISGHPHGSTAADRGFWEGQSLPAILAALGEQLAGARAGWALERQRFPLLVKLLDAQQDLSLQVHPGDEYALVHEHGELGKTEMWYVLHADPGASLILGLKSGTTRAAFEAALAANRVETVLNRVPIAAGQSVDVPTGTVHALLAGTVVAEIQQNSDTTYRVHDWGRVGVDGKPRALHIGKALDVSAFGQPAAGIVQPRPISAAAGVVRRELVRNRYFVVEEMVLSPGRTFRGRCDGSTLEIWGCMAGEVAIGCAGALPVPLPAIRFALLPASLGAFEIVASAPSVCLRAYLPEIVPGAED